MRALRPAIFWVHLVAGVVAGVIVLVMSATGVALTFEKQLLAAADARAARAAGMTVPTAATPRLPLDSLVAAARAARPARAKGEPTAVTVRADRTLPVTVQWGREAQLLVDPYTARPLGPGATTVRGALRKTTDWHRWLGMSGEGRKTGKAITGACNLAFLVLVLTGAYLWIPRRWTWAQVRQVAWFRRGLSGKARDFNWHHVLGVWCALPLAVVVASGAVISYPWASDLVYRAVGEAPPPRTPEGGREAAREGTRTGVATAARDGAREGTRRDGEPRAEASRTGGTGAADAPPVVALAPLLAVAERQMAGWRTITVQLPRDLAKPVQLSVDAGSGGQPQRRGTLSFDAATGAVRKWEPFAALTPGRRLRSVLRFAHTGEVLGIAGQTIAGLAALGAVYLVVTGLSLSTRRLARWRTRRAMGPLAPAVAPTEAVAA